MRRLTLLALLAVVVVGCGGEFMARDIAISDAQVDETSRRLVLTVGSCQAEELRAEVVRATSESVRVLVRGRRPREENDCADGVRVTLDRPLGKRVLVDDSSDREVPVGVPSS